MVGRRSMAHRKGARSDRRCCDDLEVIRGPEVADFEFAQADDAERRRLDAADPNHAANAWAEQRLCGGSGGRQLEYFVCLFGRPPPPLNKARLPILRFM